MKQRPTFICWNCERDYTLLKDTSQAKLIVECPYCNAKAEVDLAPYREQAISTFKGPDGAGQSVGELLNLPQRLPTTPIQDDNQS